MKYKNKKGYTLIEIIVCIGVLAIVGVVSVLGINYVSNNIRISKLKDIEDEIMTAAKIYLETNSAAQTQLYSKDNAVIVPLNVLVNEGLLDLTMTDLDKDDIKDEYILTGRTTTETDSNGCVNITSTSSWNMSTDNPLYICTDSNGNSNLAIINPNSVGNINTVMKEPYVFRGGDPNNYMKFTKNEVDYFFRIYYVDIDDTIVIYDDSKSKLEDTFNGRTDNLCGRTDSFTADYYGVATVTFPGFWFNVRCDKMDKSAKLIEQEDVHNTELGMKIGNIVTLKYFPIRYLCQGYSSYRTHLSYMGKYFADTNEVTESLCRSSGENDIIDGDEGYKLRLKSCMKITTGTGDKAKPFILEDKC